MALIDRRDVIPLRRNATLHIETENLAFSMKKLVTNRPDEKTEIHAPH